MTVKQIWSAFELTVAYFWIKNLMASGRKQFDPKKKTGMKLHTRGAENEERRQGFVEVKGVKYILEISRPSSGFNILEHFFGFAHEKEFPSLANSFFFFFFLYFIS